MRKYIYLLILVPFFFNCSKFASVYNKGLQSHDKDNYDEAENFYLEALKIKPNDADLNNNLGCLYLTKKDYENAKIYLEKAVNFGPNKSNFHYNLGLLYQNTGERTKAIKEYEESLNLDKKNYKAAFNIANLYFDTSDYNNAERYFKRCIDINPRFYDSYYNLALNYERKGEKDNAVSYYQQYSRYLTNNDERLAINEIINELESVEEYISGEEKPPFPANLVITNREFREPSGNNALDAEEEAEFIITLENKSKYPGNVHIKLTPLVVNTGVIANKDIDVGVISGLEKKYISIPIIAAQDVPGQECAFRVEVLETYYHLDPNPFTFSFNTLAFKKPELTVILRDINDNKSISPTNNNNGLVDPMEMIRVELSVQNIGEGIAENVKAVIEIDKTEEQSIFFRTIDGKTENEFDIGNLESGEFKRIPFLFFTNTFYNYPEVNINVAAKDSKNYSSREEDIKLQMGIRVVTGDEFQVAQIEKRTGRDIVIEKSSLVDVDDVPVIEANLNKRENTLAVIIGIEEYRFNAPATFKNRDATMLYQYMVNVVGIPDKNIFLRTNDGASKAELDYLFDERIGWLKKRVKKGITDIIVYLAGHGYPDIETGTPYYIPYDVRAEQASNGISLRELYDKLVNLEAKNVLVFIESCFSGMSFENQPLAANINPVGISIKYPEFLSANLVAMTAASGTQVSSNSEELKHGIFTYYLLKAIKGEADTDRDKNLTLLEIWDYIQNNVPEEALKLDREQNPAIMPNIEILGNYDIKKLNIVSY